MRSIIAFVLGNFTLTFFVLGLIASAIALAFSRQPRTFPVVVEALLPNLSVAMHVTVVTPF